MLTLLFSIYFMGYTYSTVLYYKDKENEPWLAKEIARAISQSLKQRTIWHKGLNACMYITSDMKVGHYTEPWPTYVLPLYACKGWFNLIVCADAVYSLTHISAMTCRGGLGK